jgi:hypothetical protein
MKTLKKRLNDIFIINQTLYKSWPHSKWTLS